MSTQGSKTNKNPLNTPKTKFKKNKHNMFAPISSRSAKMALVRA